MSEVHLYQRGTLPKGVGNSRQERRRLQAAPKHFAFRWKTLSAAVF